MVNTNSRDTMKLWEPHTNKIKYCPSAKIYEHKDKFGKVWTPGSELITGTTVSTVPTFIYLSIRSYLHQIYDIFEVTLKFPPRVTPIGIVYQSCEHNNMSYISK